MASLDFREASSRAGGRINAIQELARKQPGKLLRSGLKKMHLHCNPLIAGLAGGDTDLPPTAIAYMNNIVTAARGQSLGKRDSRELRTLATALDLLASGRVECVGDLLMQRFKSVELTSKDGTFDVGQAYELLPRDDVSATTATEQHMANKSAMFSRKVDEALYHKRNRNSGGG